MARQSLISIIIPVYNAEQYLSQCLAAINKSSYFYYEVIIVDDASTDKSLYIARKNGTTVIRLQRNSGPAAARNHGAKNAKGDILLFIDSDVLIRKETLAIVAKNFVENPDIAALFGSYDDEPAEQNFVSQYKNLVHHFVHQQSRSKAATFWAGCGAIRKDVFHAVGGFDEKKYSRPCIEDIELGYRLRNMNYRILLDKELQVKHLKKWYLGSLLRADIFYRAIPWIKLILETDEMVNDLNLQISQRISAILVGLMFLIIPLSILNIKLLATLPFIMFLIFLFNYRLFAFFFERKGIIFALRAFPMQLLYYLYSGMTFTFYWAFYRLFPAPK